MMDDLYKYELNDVEEKMISDAENEAFGCDVEIKTTEDDILLLLDSALQCTKSTKVSIQRIESLLEVIKEMYDALPEDVPCEPVEIKVKEEVMLYPEPEALSTIYTPQTLFTAFLKSLFV